MVPPGAGLLPATGCRSWEVDTDGFERRSSRTAIDGHRWWSAGGAGRRPPSRYYPANSAALLRGILEGADAAPAPTVVRRDGGIYALERALQRRGFDQVAGADEAGRGACAGPLVVAAAILPASRRGEIDGLTDSKLLTPLARERVYAEVVAAGAGLRRWW